VIAVNFGGPIDFGTATYSDSVSRRASNDSVPADANVTANIAGAESSFFVIGNVTSYEVSWKIVPPPPEHKGPPQKQKVYKKVGQSDGKTPLHVSKGQAVSVSLALRLPSTKVPPGPAAASLNIQGDSWGATAIVLNANFISVDESTPIGVKWDEMGGLSASGTVLANAQSMPDGVGAYQIFNNGTIVYSPDFGAWWLSKAVYDKLNSSSLTQGTTATGQIIRDYLGYPTGDTFATVEEGGEATLFEHGMIVVRAAGVPAGPPGARAAWAVYGPIYLHYSGLGAIASGTPDVPVVGLPISDEEVAPNGRCSHFVNGDIYWQGATGAWEVHGAIRDRWNTLGGPSSSFGYPTSDELPVMSGSNQVGRYNTFAGGGRIYWSPTTGAFEVYGAIKDKYLISGGPVGALGFPISGETDTPGGGRFNQFQNGFIVWHASGPFVGAIPVGNSAQLQLFSYQDTNHDSFNVQINITDSNGQVNHGRMPASDNYQNGNQQFNPPATLMSAPNLTGNYTMDVWMLCIHENTFGSDDEDGTVTAHYSIDNLWGTTDSSMHSNGSFNVNMKPMPQPQIFSTDLDVFRKNLFWPFHNFDTFALSWTEYSETFTDVGEGDLGFNVLPWNWHLFERAFFELVYRYLAEHGNCFGMCLESIYAREFLTMFVEPIYDSPDNTYSKDALGSKPDALNPNDAVVVEQVHIKHGYQLGAQFIYWLLGMEMQNEIQDPALAFKTSRDAFAKSDWPIIMMAPSALSQHGHVVVPYAWLVSFSGAPPITASDEAINSQPLPGQQWIIRVANPQCTPDAFANDYLGCEILIDPFQNTFTFQKNGETWHGEKGSDGRILCATFDLLNYEPHTLGDAIFALLTGLLIVIFSTNGETQQITDEAGRTYYSYTTPPPQVRTINRDRRTRVPGMTFVPAYNTAAPAAVTGSVPFELYCITRPPAGFKWPSGRLAIAASAKRGLTILPQWLNQNVVGPRLIFELKTDRQSPYHWNLIAPRMSIDISSTTAADAVDVVTISDPGDSAQKVTLLTDKKAAARNFNFAVGGWRGNWRRATKVYSLSNVALEPGTSFSAGVSDGGKELWVHNSGKTTKCDLELYVGAQPQAILKKPNVTLDAGKVFRIRPSDWKAETMGNATIGMVVFDPANGQLLKSQTL
jgi:hypothetical protein